MALVIALVAASAHAVTYRLTEDGNAADSVVRDVPADLVAGPLNDLLNPAAALANQAAARALLDSLDVSSYSQLSTTAGATAFPSHSVDADVLAGGNPGNFELNIAGEKAADADTATRILTLRVPHSIIA